jgi:hypothetical protein
MGERPPDHDTRKSRTATESKSNGNLRRGRQQGEGP